MTQKVVATSSAESEFYAAAGSLQEGIFIQRIWNFLQHHVEDEGALTRDEASSSARSQLILRCDGSACRGIMRKVGTGKAKHIATSVLWTQELAKQRRVRITAVHTLLNVADVFTKALPVKRIHMLMGVMHFFWNESGEQVGFDELMEEIYKQDRKMSFKEALQILRTEQSRVKMSDVKRVAKVLLVLTNVPGVDASEQLVPEITEQSSTWYIAISILVVFSFFTGLYIVYRCALNWWDEQRKEIRQEVRDMLNISAELEYDYIEQVRANLAWTIQELRENLTSRIDEIALGTGA